MKSIRNKIILGVTLIFLISFLTSIYLTNRLVKNQTEKIVDKVADVNIELLDEIIETFLKTHEESLNQLARNKTFVELSYAIYSNNNELASKLEKDFINESKLFMKQYPSTSAVMFGSSNKQYKNYPVKNYESTTYDVTTRPWYTNGMKNTDKVTVTDPYIDARTKEQVITLSKTMKYGDQTTGVLSIDISLDNLLKLVHDNEMAFKGEPFIINNEGLAITHPTKQGEDLSNLSVVQKILKSEQSKDSIEYELDNEMKMLHYNKIPDTDWIIGISFGEKNMFELADNVQSYLLIIAGIILVITVIVIGFISLAITRPINQLKAGVEKITDGDLTVHVNVQTKDETGQLGQLFNNMVHQLRGIISTVNQSSNNVLSSSENLSAVSEETQASSEQIATAIAEIATGASHAAEDADKANQLSITLGDDIQRVSDKTKEMLALTEKTNTLNTKGLHQIKELQSTNEVTNGFVTSMGSVIAELNDKIKTIEKVMETITAISAQTNLLALNAGIEAARAGEHGQGFAVVANEVKTLAEQSVLATEDVKKIVQAIQDSSKKAVDEMDQTGEIFNKQALVIQDTNNAFIQISTLIQSMAQSIDSISEDIKNVASNKDYVLNSIQVMAGLAQQTAAACEEVNASVDEQARSIYTVAEDATNLTTLSYDLQQAVRHFKIKEE